jgi:hypothetical protein
VQYRRHPADDHIAHSPAVERLKKGFEQGHGALIAQERRSGPTQHRVSRRRKCGGEAIAEILDGTLPREQWHSPFWKLRQILVNPVAVRFFNWVMSVPRTVS